MKALPDIIVEGHEPGAVFVFRRVRAKRQDGEITDGLQGIKGDANGFHGGTVRFR